MKWWFVSLSLFLALAGFYQIKPGKKDMEIIYNQWPLEKTEKLDPATMYSTTEYAYLKNLNITLVDIDKNSQYRNQLAKSIDLGEGHQKITIEIKEATFSDGSPITVEDVTKSLKRAIIKGTPHTDAKALFQDVESLKTINDNFKGIEILGDRTLRLNLKNPTKEILYFLQLTDFAILHPSQYSKEEIKMADYEKVTSGPYKLSFDEEGRVIFL
ncbi:MAG: ABC transporter substrate-binding protein, partial [Bdellovibrionales bacterium]|nr:ABC transporter substrate-binding protein [Bdellovibrionales bacterium]